MKQISLLFPAVSAALLSLAPVSTIQAAGSLRTYASAPGVSTDTYSGAQIETFDSFATGTFTSLTSTALALGGVNATYLAGSNATKPSILANDQYAASATSNNYLAVNGNNSVTLTLASAVPYVGLDISAVDGNDNVSFYDAGNTLIGTFNAADITALLPNNTTSTVTAVNGSKYNTNQYYGQPTGQTQNGSEAYVYLHFFGQNGTTIKRIVFSQGPGGQAFETENHSLLTSQPAVDGTFVSVGTVVPEPGVSVMIAAGCMGLLALGRLRRGRQ